MTNARRRAWWPGGWLVSLAIACGVLAGVGGVTFDYAEGLSYFSTDPAACTNCHIMQPQFDSWQKASHHAVAGCVDCHLPHETIPKYLSKADNGFFHSLAFTSGDFPDQIRIKPRNRRGTQKACVHCHAELVDHLRPVDAEGDMVLCVHCHASVGHAQR